MYVGIYNRKLDEKMRVALPKSIEHPKNLEIYLIPNTDEFGNSCIMGSNVDYITKMAENKSHKFPIVSSKVDRQNRILIPYYYREIIVNPSKTCTFMGFGDFFRLYESETGKKYLENISKRFQQL